MGWRYDGTLETGRPRSKVAAAHAHAWRDLANCNGMDPNLFVFEDRGAIGRRKAADARAVCAGCQVRLDCLAHAIRTNEEDGIYGGTTERQRRALRRAMRHLAGHLPSTELTARGALVHCSCGDQWGPGLTRATDGWAAHLGGRVVVEIAVRMPTLDRELAG